MKVTRTRVGLVLQAFGACVAVAGLYLLVGLALTLLIGGVAVVVFGSLLEAGRA